MNIKPTNNAKGLMVKTPFFLRGKVTVVADFGRQVKQTAVFNRKELLEAISTLSEGGYVDFKGNLLRIHWYENKLRLFFKPVNGCDLVVVLKKEMVEALR